MCRGSWHCNKIKGRDQDHFITRHNLEKHPGDPSAFTMSVRTVHPTPRGRQVQEGVNIGSIPTTQTLNSKTEWHGAHIVRWTAQIGLPDNDQ